MSYYIDTNIWVYAILAHHKYGKRCGEILKELEVGQLKAVISTQVIAELAGVLYSQYGVRDTTGYIDAVLSYPLDIYLVYPDTIRAACEYARSYRILPYDGIHIALAVEHGLKKVLSADKELDKIDFIERIDPLEYGKNRDKPPNRSNKLEKGRTNDDY
mgnify:CR=1 FL=1